MHTFAKYSVEEILPLIGKDAPRIHLNSHSYLGMVSVGACSPRLRCFKNNQTCVRCGIVGNIFGLDGTYLSPPKGYRHCYIEHCDWCLSQQWNRNNPQGATAPHLNLYHRDGENMTLMTQDHIIPKSKGGSKHSQSNLQTMCTFCNNKKGDMLPHEWLAELYRNTPSVDEGSFRMRRLQALEQYADHLARRQSRAA